MNNRNKLQIISGDFNINILNTLPNSIEQKYLDALGEAGFLTCIDQITRSVSNSCLDHFFYKIQNYLSLNSAVIQTSITDHYTTYLKVINFKHYKCGETMVETQKI